MTTKKTADIAKDVAIGIVLGGAVGSVVGAMKQPSYQRTAKKGLNKAMKTFSGVLGAIS